MASPDSDAERFNRIVVWSLAVTAVLLLVLPMFFVLSNETYYSAYVEGGDTDEEKFAQLSTMRSTLIENVDKGNGEVSFCLLYTSPSPRDRVRSRMPSSA